MTTDDWVDVGLSIGGDISMIISGGLFGRAGDKAKKLSKDIYKKIKPETGISNDAKALLNKFDESTAKLDENIRDAKIAPNKYNDYMEKNGYQ